MPGRQTPRPAWKPYFEHIAEYVPTERETGLEPALGPLLSMPAIGDHAGWRILEPADQAAWRLQPGLRLRPQHLSACILNQTPGP